MSKFLKFIVNIVLIVAIASAAAILVPPMLGVSTTIVDSTAMDTNLKLGSVTYSTNVDVSELQVGDEVLKENGSSTYAYILTATDPTGGEFKGVSATDPNGREETVMLRNSVPKVAVTVPALGYLIIAMQSVEGRLIIILAVVLIVILFVLSELWKPLPEDEEEEEPERGSQQREAEEEEEPHLTARDDTGIDTEAIREAVAENQSASGLDGQEDLSEDDDFDLGSGLASLLDDEQDTEESAPQEDEPEAALNLEEDETEPAAGEEEHADSLDALLDEHLAKTEEAAEEQEPADEEESAGEEPEDKEPEDEKEPADDTLREEKTETEEPQDSGEAGGSRKEGRRSILAEALENASEVKETEDAPEAENAPKAAAVPDADAGPVSESPAGEPTDTQQTTEPETQEEDLELLDITGEAAGPQDGKFTPVERPDLDKLLEEAQNSGKNPKKTTDQNTGVTVFDYTGIL